ncbi:hypothetical protein D3C86_1963100 [compost metagenome]
MFAHGFVESQQVGPCPVEARVGAFRISVGVAVFLVFVAWEGKRAPSAGIVLAAKAGAEC